MTSKRSIPENNIYTASNEQIFNLIFERHAAIMLLIQPDTGKILNANQAAVDFYGYPKSKLCSMLIHELNTLPPEQVAAERQKALIKQRNYFIFPHRLANGEERIVEVHSSPIDLQEGKILFSIIHDVTERKQAEAALQKSEAHYAFIANNTNDVIWALSLATGKYTYVSPSVQKLRGYTPDEVMNQTMAESLTPESLQKSTALIQARLANRKPGDTSSYTSITLADQPCKDGSVVSTEAVGTMLFDKNGAPVEIIGVSRDITERKQMEKALRQSEEKYRTVANFTYDWEVWRGSDNTYLYVSPSCERISGHTAAEFLADPDLIVQITHPDDKSMVMAHFQSTANESKRADLEFDFRILSPDGETRWIAHSCTVVYGLDGKWLGRRESNREITERKQAEEILRESEDKFKYLFEHSTVGKSFTLRTGEVDVNQALCDMLGYTLPEFKNKKWQEITHPDDIELTQREIDQLLSGKRDSARFIKRFIHKDGSVVWVDLSSSIRRDANGNPLYLMSSVIDITQRKQAEDALRESEDKHRLITQMQQGVAVHEIILNKAGKAVDYRFLEVNDSYERLTGLKRENVIGKTAREILPNPDSDRIKRYGQVAMTGEPIQYESYVKELGRYFEVVAYSPQPEQVAVIISDITERKLAEENLRASEIFFKNILNSLTANIAVLDEHGMIIAVNDAWKNFAHENDSPDPAAYLGTNYLATCRAAAEAGDLTALQIVQNISALLDGSLMEFSAEYPCNSPTQERWFTVTGVPERGFRKGAILIHQNVTDRKKAELELQQKEHQESVIEIDRQIKRLQSEVTQNISHELRTPMTQIMLTLELVLREKFGSSGDLNWFVESALSQTHRLNTIVDSLIFLSDHDAGVISVIREDVDPILNFGLPIKNLTEQYKDKALKIEIRVAEDLKVSAPINSFTLACTQLVDNSLKFSPPKGSVLIDLASNGNGGCILTITDRGPGIPEDLHEKVFERYFQVSQGTTREYGGLGVGLTIARIVARSLGGDVTILPATRGFRIQMVIPPAPLDK
jgi:PAS domain S-box-containing protein